MQKKGHRQDEDLQSRAGEARRRYNQSPENTWCLHLAFCWLGYTLCTVLGYGAGFVFSSLLSCTSVFIYVNGYHRRPCPFAMCCLHSYPWSIIKKCPSNCLPYNLRNLPCRSWLQVNASKIYFNSLKRYYLQDVIVKTFYLCCLSTLVSVYFHRWLMEWMRFQRA